PTRRTTFWPALVIWTATSSPDAASPLTGWRPLSPSGGPARSGSRGPRAGSRPGRPAAPATPSAASPPPAPPRPSPRPAPEPMEGLLRRWARTHVPFLAVDVAARWGLPPSEVEQVLRRLAVRGDLVAGAFRHGVSEREYCHPEVLRTLRRRSLAALRREAEP